MAWTNIDFSDEEEIIISTYAKKFGLNKSRTIKKLISDYSSEESL